MTKNLWVGNLKNYVVMFCVAGALLTSCSKSIDKPLPGNDTALPEPTGVQFTLQGIATGADNYKASISIENSAGETVVKNQQINLQVSQSGFVTDKLELTKGSYKLTSLIVVRNSDTAVYAAPKLNTLKAGQVTKPLSLDMSVADKQTTTVPVQVLKINKDETATIYGYTDDEFGKMGFLKLKLHLKITVAQVLYDSLPGKLKIDATDKDGQHWTKEIELAKGLNEVNIPEQFVTARFEILKWNTIISKILNRSEVTNHMLVELEGTRQALRLIKETSYLENGGGLQEDSRTEYFYNGNNRLLQVKNYQHSTIVSGLPLTNVYNFSYSGLQLDSIIRLGGDNVRNGFTAFGYAGNKIINVSNKSYDQEIHGAVQYSKSGSINQTHFDYLFSNGNTMTYDVKHTNGNRISDNARTSTNGSESGTYEYDSNINPYQMLGYPDIYLSQDSKNNMVKQTKNYSGGFPTSVPYKYEYVYNADGYPAELYTSYKGYTSGQHLYRIRKVFQYQ